jgi:hypothetical protein
MPLSYIDFPVKKLTGHTLARNGYSKSQRAAFAASFILGEVEITKPTHIQVAKVFNVSIPYIQKALALSPTARAVMRAGYLDMAGLPPAKAELERVIGRAGNEPAWQVICRRLDELSNEPTEQADLFDDNEPGELNGLDQANHL